MIKREDATFCNYVQLVKSKMKNMILYCRVFCRTPPAVGGRDKDDIIHCDTKVTERVGTAAEGS